MSDTSLISGEASLLARKDFPALLDTLWEQGYQVYGPVVRDGTVCWGSSQSCE